MESVPQRGIKRRSLLYGYGAGSGLSDTPAAGRAFFRGLARLRI